MDTDVKRIGRGRPVAAIKRCIYSSISSCDDFAVAGGDTGGDIEDWGILDLSDSR